MLISRLWDGLVGLQAIGANQQTVNADDKHVSTETWDVLGPFQIGTREAPWSADPLEFHGGFRSFEYSENATFRSSIGIDGTIGWSKHEARITRPDDQTGIVELSVAFPGLETDWGFLQSVYGWAALQWQGWARGEILVHPESVGTYVLHTENILECWIDDVHYFGGDFYGYGRAPLTLRLDAGSHRIDIRLVRDVRAFGAVGAPTVDVKLRLERSSGGLGLLYGYGENVLISEVVGGTFGPLASPYASITMRNDAETDLYIHSIEGMGGRCAIEMLSKDAIRLIPGQTRPIGFKIACVPSYDKNLHLEIKYSIDGIGGLLTRRTSTWPDVAKSMTEPHRVTFLHPSGMVSYAILRPPSESSGKSQSATLPVLLALHGAGLDADDPLVRHAFDDLSDLPAWVLFPTGATPWSGDDWHVWGWADVEAAIAMIPDWIRQVDWQGPGVDTSKFLVTGHSNGGQGSWYALTHHFDRVIAAAPLSGYSSIENYVSYTFWRTADPARMAIVHDSMNSYRHDILLENSRGIPVLEQHGSLDSNVPAYHSRLMSQRIQEAGIDGTSYFEMEGKPHYWDGVMTTGPLRDFFQEHLHESRLAIEDTGIDSFSLVVANPAEAGHKFGVKVIHLHDPAHLGRIELSYDHVSGRCAFFTSNILQWIMPQDFRSCRVLLIDRQEVDVSRRPTKEHSWVLHEGVWQLDDSIEKSRARLPMRSQPQLGHMDAILRTKGPFSIVPHTPEAAHVALQASRNLYQYFAADTNITDDYAGAVHSVGNIISLAIGPSLPQLMGHPIEISNGEVVIHVDALHTKIYAEADGHGLGAIFLRPLLGDRLELVIWAKYLQSLDVAARLLPMMPGSGQPDFVVVDDRMLSTGVGGARAVGFFDAWWQITKSSFLS